MANSTSVNSLLKDLGLEEYFKRFISQGFEGLTDLFTISEEDLDSLCIQNKDHKKAILKAVDELPAKLWLEINRLETYTRSFEEERIEKIKNLKDLQISEDLMDNLEIMVPGHRKRFSLAVQSLQSSISMHEPKGPFSPSNAVAVGYWNRPDNFDKLEHELLCVKGCFRSVKDENKQSDMLEFMVDSGSEVVTARASIIEEVGLKFVKDIKSCGIHGSAPASLYEGTLKLGNSEWITVEVQESYYESIGAPLMRNFRHIINRNSHYWIPSE